jgi:hypothetical protein
MKPLKVIIAILTLSLLSGCGSNPDALKKEGCENFLKGVDRLNVDDTAYESFNKAYKAFDKLAKNDAYFVKFGSIAYELSDPNSSVAWSDIDEVASYCGDPVFSN